MKKIALVLSISAAVITSMSWAADYPAPGKTIRLVVPFAPGSGTDLMSRILAEDMQKGLGASIIVENRPGANGIVAAEYISRQEPDGYTLILGTSSAYSANPWLIKNLPYDAIKSVTPIARTTNFPFLLAASGDSKIKTLEDFINYVKSSDRILMGYGNATGQVANMHLMSVAKFNATSVPYKSTPPAMVDLVGGRFDFMFVDAASSRALVTSGKIRPLAVMSDERSSLVPGVPGLGETYPGFDYVAWGGLMGPPGMQPDVVRRLNAEAVKSLGKEDIKARFAMAGLEPYPSSAEEFATFIVDQKAAWGAKIRAAGIEPQ